MSTQESSKLGSDLPINYEFFFNFLDGQYPDSRSRRVLDYGCGDGLIVREGVKRGYQIFGTDNLHEDADRAAAILSRVQADGLPIRTITAHGKIPWPDSFFDVIISNQVIEHVADLDLVVAELHRVLRGGGVMLHVFPTRERVMEGHIGLPLVHWLPAQSKVRWLWAWVMRKLGFGFGWRINTRPDHEWVNETLNYIDHYAFYRNWKEVQRCFSRFFFVKSYTRQELAFHLANKRGAAFRILQRLLRFAPTAAVLERLRWWQGGRAILCRLSKQERN